jgi:methylthioribulose-1-phosphate dehydratase
VADAIIGAGRRMDQRGWVPATAGNISLRFHDEAMAPEGRIAITRSGVHKGLLDADGVIEVDFSGRPVVPGNKPSAETLLHCQILARFPETNAVVHGHSVAGTVLSMAEAAGTLVFEGYELFKAFAGQATHEARLALPLFANDQDMVRLAGVVAPHLADMRLGYYIRGHGIYVWGPDMAAAVSRLEAIEFLLDCELQRRLLALPARAASGVPNP